MITVPAFFNETQREATREAGELAGLEVVRIINEPTAASLTYDPHPEKMERLLVYDLGGGTFDVSIVQIEQGVVEVLSSHGDTHLGGDDFDQLLLDLVCDDFLPRARRRSPPVAGRQVARAARRRGGEEAALLRRPSPSIEEEFIAEKKGAPLHLRREIRRNEYEDLIEPLLAKTLQLRRRRRLPTPSSTPTRSTRWSWSAAPAAPPGAPVARGAARASPSTPRWIPICAWRWGPPSRAA